MSCLFDSLSYFFQNINSKELRNIICDYLELNPKMKDMDLHVKDIIKHESEKSINKYVRRMRKRSTWGGAIEIKSFCEIFKLEVEVKYNNRNVKPILFKPYNKNSNYRLILGYTGNHYVPRYLKIL